MAPGVDSDSNRNEYQEYFLGDKDGRCLGLITLPPLCADCLEILGSSTSWGPKDLFRPVTGLLYLFLLLLVLQIVRADVGKVAALIGPRVIGCLRKLVSLEVGLSLASVLIRLRNGYV
jgi:hypothetical protein